MTRRPENTVFSKYSYALDDALDICTDICYILIATLVAAMTANHITSWSVLICTEVQKNKLKKANKMPLMLLNKYSWE